MLEVLEKFYNNGLVYKQIHPTLPLTIWNYSEKVQYNELWSEVTLQTRGLVTDDKGNIVGRPFPKFFNLVEGKHIPTSDFDVYVKLDGSLGILFHYDGQWVFATRGSFTSEQSVKGFEMLSKYDYDKLHKDYTYLFEILFDDNRIVVRYDYEDVVLIGMIHTKSGEEVDIHNGPSRFMNMISNIGLKVVKKYDGIKDYSMLKGMIGDNEEGYVVKFSNGNRMKIKGEEYLRLHKIMTNVSTTYIWEMLSKDMDINQLLKDVPDEFFDKIKSYVKDLKYIHYSISEYCGKLHDGFRYGKYGDVDPEPSKKEYAEFVKKNVKPELQGVMFQMWDKKNYRETIWKLIKPEFKKL